MPSAIRLKRIADRLRQEISEMLLREINDPRLRQIFITDVRIDRELAYADVYVSAVEGSKRSKEILAGFKAAGGFFRRALAARVELRSFPRLRFHWDPTPEQADHIEKVLADLRVKENAPSPGDSKGVKRKKK
ncbi:MAG: ribosome-binding factor A [Chloroflexi bacterium RBG_16_51_16]|nr:MAG: ribosome-binding factor A [Chloroflexi bacterium RBG_16_51_16]